VWKIPGFGLRRQVGKFAYLALAILKNCDLRGDHRPLALI
jgi:hypothetical protein